MIHGLPPGPLLVKQTPDVFWGIITSMYTGNAMLLVLNLPLIPLWARLLRVPYATMYPLILLFCLIGAYSVGNNIGDGIVMWVFGIVGYLLKKFDYEGAPLILAMVIGPMMEEALRQSLILCSCSFPCSRGSAGPVEARRAPVSRTTSTSAATSASVVA